MPTGLDKETEMDGTKRLGEVLPAINAAAGAPSEDRATDSFAALSRLNLAKLPERLTDSQIEKLEEMISGTLPSPEPCRERDFFQLMATMRASLPSQNRDGLSEDLQAEAYYRMLREHTFDQINRMVEIALATCEFFPTIAKCKEIILGVPVVDHLKAKRAKIVEKIDAEKRRRFWDNQTAFETMMRRLSREPVPQAEIDELPDSWKQNAVTYGYLRRLDEGGFEQRGVLKHERED